MRNSLVTWTMIILGHWVAVVWSQPANAQGFENLDRLDSIVATTVGAGIGQPGGAVAPVDRRLRLAACPQIPSIEGPVFGAAILRCDRLGWRIRVPLALAQQAPAGYATPAASAYGRGVSAAAARTMLIKKGDPVQLVAGDSMFSVTRAMIAEEDGAIGDMIRVREDKSSAPVSGRIEPNGIVRIPGI